MADAQNLFTGAGIFLIALGAILVALPFIIRLIPNLEAVDRLPSYIVYVYRRGDFFFATSPILLLAGLIYFLYLLFR